MTVLDRQIKSRLKGKTVWITGGKRVGQTIARAFAEQGAHIAVSYLRSRKEADATVKMAQSLGSKAVSVQMDAGSRESAFEAVRAIAKTFSKIDVLVSMASIFHSVRLREISQKEWDDNYQSHILGSFWPLQAALPRMPKGAHVVNIADRTSIGRSYKNYLPYIVTKSAVEALTRAAAKELGERGVFVNAVAPGPILRPPETPQKEWDALRRSSPVQYPIDDREAVEQFAVLVLYLSTLTMTSGRTYSLDQGQSL